MPMATIGYIEDDNGTAGNSNDDFWRECVNNDVSSGWVATIAMEVHKLISKKCFKNRNHL